MKFFKLSTSLSTRNFVLYDHKGKIKIYQDEREIIDEFFKVRE
jgi:hypothetical protein